MHPKITKTIARIKARPYFSAFIMLVAIFAIYQIYQKTHPAQIQIKYITSAVQKTTIVKSVASTGQVAQLNKIDIKASSSGLITALPVKQGQTVKKGQLIAVIDQRNNYVSLAQARAGLANAQANYQKLIAGATSEEIQIAQASVASAQTSLENTKNSFAIIEKQQTLAIKNAKATLLNTTPTALAATNNLSTASITIGGSYNSVEEGAYTITLYTGGDGLHYLISGLENFDRPITPGITMPLGMRGLTITIGTTGSLVAGSTWTVSLPNTMSSSFVSNYNSYQSALLTQIQALTNAKASIAAAENSLTQQKAVLAQKIAAAQPADVAVSEAQIATARAQLLSAEAAFSNNNLIAPFDGQIVAVPLQIGEQATGVIATLITPQKIAALSLNEVDIAKIKIGDKASLAFDAIDGLSITGEVAQIDTLGTVTQGVVNYAVKIIFDTQDDRIKPGMSANAAIILEAKSDVLAVPASAVKTQDSNSYVQQLDASGKPQNISVTIGLTTDTQIEILTGLTAGQTIVTQTIKIDPNAAATAATARSANTNPFAPQTGRGGGGRAGGG